MKNILVAIILLGIITGIIPILLASFLAKHILLVIVLGLAELIWLGKELCM